MSPDFLLFSGTAHPRLAAAVAGLLPVALGKSRSQRYPDGEWDVQLLQPVRRKEVFLLQPTAPPVNDHLLELLALADACRRASAAHISAVMPYFGYSRSDKRHARREPIAASMVAALLETVGVRHVITLDLHAAQIEGFFHIPVDSLTAVPVLCAALGDRLPPGTVVVAPDTGRVRMASEYAQRLNTSVVVLHKSRESGTQTHITHVVGQVAGRSCLIVDDMISTGGTLLESIAALRQAGCQPPIYVAATHGLLLGGAPRLLQHADLAEVWVTDSVPPPAGAAPLADPAAPAPAGGSAPRLRIASIAPLLAGAIRRILADGSLGGLF